MGALSCSQVYMETAKAHIYMKLFPLLCDHVVAGPVLCVAKAKPRMHHQTMDMRNSHRALSEQ